MIMMSPVLGCTNLNCQTKFITKSNLIEVEKGNVISAYFSRDGKYIVTSLDDNTVAVRDISGRKIALLKGHQGRVYDVVFSPDNQTLVTKSYDKTNKNIDFFEAKFSPDGKKVITSYRKKTAQITDISELINQAEP